MSRRKKILLLGKNGMLGSAIIKTVTWSDKLTMSQFIAWGRSDLDITQKSQVLKKISGFKPDVVINAAGYTDVDGAESDSQTAFKVNADGIGYIAEACSQTGASLIHFSTDYVFDGSQPHGYVEDDVEHLKPLNSYGESKRIGELRIANCEFKKSKFFIIRTSWLYGTGGKNFVDAMLKRAADGQTEFKVVNDQWGFPTYTVDLAERVLLMVAEIEQLESGVYHITNSKFKIQNYREQEPAGITWHQFVLEIFRQARELGILSRLPNVKPCTSDEFPRPAKRPGYSALINTKLMEMREWKIALADYLRNLNKIKIQKSKIKM